MKIDFDNKFKSEIIEFRKYVEDMKGKPGALMPVLHRAQNVFGYIPKSIQKIISKGLVIPESEIFGVVTFYSYFSTEPVGDNIISVCMGTACFVRGSQKIQEKFMTTLGIKQGETTSDGMFTLKDVRCIGACGLAPVVTVNGEVHGHAKLEDVDKIIENCKKNGGQNNE